MPRRFVSYLRVSTDRQDRNGLGLKVQHAAVAGDTWTLLDELVEVDAAVGEFAEGSLLLQLCGWVVLAFAFSCDFLYGSRKE